VSGGHVTRRDLLRLGGALAVAGPALDPWQPDNHLPKEPDPRPEPISPPLLIRGAALADGRSATLQVPVSVKIESGRIAWIVPSADADPGGAEVIDGGGAVLVPAMIDCHSHLTLPGGSHYIKRGSDPPHQLREVARRNAARLIGSGVLWARDVGSPRAGGQAVSLSVRDELDGRPGQPYIRVAGTWIAKSGYLPSLAVQVPDGDRLLAAAMQQLDHGTDLVKVMMDSPGSNASSPFSVAEMRRVVDAVHARAHRIAAHSQHAAGAGVAASAGVDSIEHGFDIPASVAQTMAAGGVTLVSTLSVLASLETFARTTPEFAGTAGIYGAARESAFASVAAAKRAGVKIAAGSDFGGGSVRAGHLHWEVDLLVRAGLEPWEALAAVTWRGGELLGEEHAGRLEQGAPADLVLVHGDPLSDPAALGRVWAVFQRGVRIA
jgi:imidazolonepropionase-like amidohydrolase